ncbi:MAG: ADP-forming succinate--CoA ligase subunit beta, partial [Candidatus Margulisiibacteriota bacterium]
MKLHEYQAKDIFEQYGIPVTRGRMVTNAQEARQVAQEMGTAVVVKAQVHVGGRGKAGGVKVAQTPDETFTIAQDILGLTIKGLPVKKILVAQAEQIEREIYIGITLDISARKIVFLASSAGGVDIEEVAQTTPEKIIKIYIDPLLGFMAYQKRQLAYALFTQKEQIAQAQDIFGKLYRVFRGLDCSLAEINPLIITSHGQLLALDSKLVLDDNGLIKHPELEELRDMDAEEEDEIEAKNNGLTFIKLDGEIGCVVNGAGLAMATMDIIKLFGGEPANFLDVGGSSNPNKIVKAFQIILKNKKIKAVFINIFGGITRCDDIANGLLEARKQMDIPVPIVIRLAGTNEEKEREILSA